MSDRDKKLLVYLGALVILAAAYFLVGKPFLDKIDELSSEKATLQNELSEKRAAFENKATYEEGITEANNKIQAMMDKFPEDNTDEKSIMFIVNTEKEIPAWVGQIKFADIIENTVTGESASDREAAAEQEAVAAAEGEDVSEGTSEPAPEVNDSGEGGNEGSGTINDLITRDTELGIKFTVKYDGFKKWLKYLNDYEDRMVIKEIDVTYDRPTDLVSGSMVISQYALLGPGRELPPVETGVEELGKENIFVTGVSQKTMIDLLGEIAKELIQSIVGTMNGALGTAEEKYFINVTTATDNTSAKTIGRAKDPAGTTYLTSNTNDKESVTFTLKGAEGRYYGEYEMGGFKVTDDEFKMDITDNVVLRIISSSRNGKDDKSSISLHLRNTSDIPLVVNIENEDKENPRIDIVDREGDVTVNE